MPAIGLPSVLLPRPLHWGVVASLLLHGTLLTLLVVGQALHIAPPELQSIDVDLLSVAQFAAMLPSQAPPGTVTVLVPRATGTAPPPSAAPNDGPFRAASFFAGNLLAEPESDRLRQAMRTLADPERMVQLCDIEAMEQVRRVRPDYDPDTVVPYAMAATELRSGTLVAAGGAFRSRRQWYELSFTCTPAADLTSVEAFEFTLGDAIPVELWEEHYLTAEEVDE